VSTIRRRLGEAGFTASGTDPARNAVTAAAEAPEHLAAGAAILDAPGDPPVDEDAGIGDVARSVVRCASGRLGTA
jgi:hypothetical protein